MMESILTSGSGVNAIVLGQDRAERSARRAAYEVVSRLIQVAVSVIGLLLFLPVMAAIAAAIKLVSPGPVIYRGKRVG